MVLPGVPKISRFVFDNAGNFVFLLDFMALHFNFGKAQKKVAKNVAAFSQVKLQSELKIERDAINEILTTE